MFETWTVPQEFVPPAARNATQPRRSAIDNDRNVFWHEKACRISTASGASSLELGLWPKHCQPGLCRPWECCRSAEPQCHLSAHPGDVGQADIHPDLLEKGVCLIFGFWRVRNRLTDDDPYSHEGRLYWFNTLYFDKQDLSKMSSFDPKKLSRRATNYFLLGLSLPTLTEINSHNPHDYLRTLYTLLAEFDAYQQVHPADGSSTSSLSRARIPSMFKRATHVSSGKGRRASSATEIGLPMGSGADSSDVRSMAGSINSTAASSASSLPANDQELVPGEGYAYLSTPFLPFDPDFYETFATLCDVLIECYGRIMNLANTPLVCPQPVGDMFAKADAKVRKIIISGIVKDFEDAGRSGVKAEVSGVGRVVLGGLV